MPNCAISGLHTFCSKVGELGRGPRSRPFATLIGASERARKVGQNAPISVSNGHDLTLLPTRSKALLPTILHALFKRPVEGLDRGHLTGKADSAPFFAPCQIRYAHQCSKWTRSRPSTSLLRNACQIVCNHTLVLPHPSAAA